MTRLATISLAVVAVLLLGGCGASGSSRSETSASSSAPGVREAGDDDFAELVLERPDDEVVLVMFTAPWSGPDRILEPVVRKATARRDMPLVLVNVDEAPRTARRFDVLSIPTLVAFAGGDAVHLPLVGAVPRGRLEAFLDRAEASR